MRMKNLVSIHPYFKVHEGKLDNFKALLPKFVAKTQGEELCYYYDFTQVDDEIYCREGYNGAAGLLHHIENVGDELGQALSIADLTRVEIHGPADELAKLKEPLGHLNPTWWEYQTGITR